MKKLLKMIFALLAILPFCVACGGKEDYASLSVEEFDSLINNEDIQLIDVRTGMEYSSGHIPRAVNINVLDNSFDMIADSTLHIELPVAVYCRSGKRSRKASAILSKKGFKVFNLEKGYNAWQQAGKPEEK